MRNLILALLFGSLLATLAWNKRLKKENAALEEKLQRASETVDALKTKLGSERSQELSKVAALSNETQAVKAKLENDETQLRADADAVDHRGDRLRLQDSIQKQKAYVDDIVAQLADLSRQKNSGGGKLAQTAREAAVWRQNAKSQLRNSLKTVGDQSAALKLQIRDLQLQQRRNGVLHTEQMNEWAHQLDDLRAQETQLKESLSDVDTQYQASQNAVADERQREGTYVRNREPQLRAEERSARSQLKSLQDELSRLDHGDAAQAQEVKSLEQRESTERQQLQKSESELKEHTQRAESLQ